MSDPEGGQQTVLREAAAAAKTEDMVRGQRLLARQLCSLDQLEGIPSGITSSHHSTDHLFKHFSKVVA